jgi:hypothetical protein
MCHLCGWLKLFLKNVRWEKIKIQKRRLLGRLSDGSFVPLLYVYFCRSFLLCRLLGLQVTFSGLAKVAIFTTNVDAENQTLINHKCVCGALNRHFCQTRVMGSGSFRSKVCRVKFALSTVRWLASSFYFFSVDLCVGKKIKCACKCVGCMSAVSCHYATFRLYKCC